MTTVTVELPEAMKEFIDNEIAAGRYESASAFFQALVACIQQPGGNGVQSMIQHRAEINELLREAEDAYERGEYTVHKPGDIRRMYEEIKRQRQAAQP
jgi:Arc/MetJ-type ribon-helix-helix transcriptional regulator